MAATERRRSWRREPAHDAFPSFSGAQESVQVLGWCRCRRACSWAGWLWFCDGSAPIWSENGATIVLSSSQAVVAPLAPGNLPELWMMSHSMLPRLAPLGVACRRAPWVLVLLSKPMVRLSRPSAPILASVFRSLLVPGQHAGEPGQLPHVGLHHVLVVADERADGPDRTRQRLERLGEVAAVGGQLAGHRGQVGHEPVHDPVVGGQGVGQLRHVLDRVEQRTAAVTEGLHCLRQVEQGLVAELAVAAQRLRSGGEQRVQRAVLVGAVGSEGLGQVGEALVDPVELHRRAGVRQLDLRVVLQLRTIGVRRGELHEAVGGERGCDDGCLGIGRQLVLVVVLHRRPERGRPRAPPP